MPYCLTDDERFPLLTDAGRRRLLDLRQHESAPTWNHRCGDRLTAGGLARAREYEAALLRERTGWRPGELPDWVGPFVERCRTEVPLYRRRAGSPAGEADDGEQAGREAREGRSMPPASVQFAFADLPTCSRDDLAREPWSFVPDSAPLDDLIFYTSSGTTGHPIHLLSHPEVSTKDLPLLKQSLKHHGVDLEGGDRVAMLLVCCQNLTYTYAMVSSYLDGAGYAKINLKPSDWRDPDDRARFIDDCDAEILAGDPISFFELAKLSLRTRPKALVSTAMALSSEFRAELEARFGCPVLDLYSSNESGVIGRWNGRGFEVVPHDLYVEVVDADGRPLPPGARGEVTLTGGHNPFLPLLRYRMGDWAALDFSGPMPLLVDLEGRPPTIFLDSQGGAVNNVDVTWALRPFSLAQFALHQSRDGSLRLSVRGAALPESTLREALAGLFGEPVPVVIEEIPDAEAWAGKRVQYTRDDARNGDPPR